MFRKILSLSLILLLCVPCLGARAEEESLSAVYAALEELLLDTENVTLRLNASFDFDGAEFKQVEASYIQAEYDSDLDLHVKTARRRDWRETGYRVVVKDGTGYSVEYPVGYGYYTFTPEWISTVLSHDRSWKVLEAGEAVVSLLEVFLDPYVSVEGNTTTVRMTQEEAPQQAGALVKLAIALLADRFMDVNSVGWDAEYEGEDGLVVMYEDWMELWEKTYQGVTGKELANNFFEFLWSGDGESEAEKEYEIVTDIMIRNEDALMEQHPEGGVALVHADGSVEYFASYGDYMIACGEENLIFEDADAAFIAWYRNRTGQEFTRQILRYIENSGNNELVSAYQALRQKMVEEYYAQLRERKAAVGFVYSDGTMEVSMDVNAYEWKDTVARIALSYMNRVRIGDSALAFTRDEEGRITSAEGDVTLIFSDAEDKDHILHFTFHATATDWDESEVQPFDTVRYQRVDEPEQVVLDGVTYDLLNG